MVSELLKDGKREQHWKRWKKYVKDNPEKYRIKHKFLKASHRTCLQEFNPDGSGWHTIERFAAWYFELKFEGNCYGVL